MKRLLGLPLLLGILFSCTLQKRHYRPGFTIFQQGKIKKVEEKTQSRIDGEFSSVRKVSAQKRVSAILIEPVSKSELMQPKVPGITPTILVTRKLTAKPRLASLKKATAFYVGVMPNHVPKAGLRMFIFSLIFFGGALFCFFSFPELVYITAGLLIIAFVFALVSLISSASARKDKINNSSGWLTIALVTLLFDILEIAAIVIFFIALF